MAMMWRHSQQAREAMMSRRDDEDVVFVPDEAESRECSQMKEEDKYLDGENDGEYYNEKAHILNLMWNAVAEEKKTWQKHGMNHTEEQYRQICGDFVDKFRQKNKEVAVAKGMMKSEIQRRKKLNDMYDVLHAEIEKVKEDNRDLKRTADKLPGYKKEFTRLSKKMRTIEDYVSSYEFDNNHRVPVDADEYYNTDPDLRMFFTLE